MKNHTEQGINRRALLHGIGAYAGAASAQRALMGASRSSHPTKQSKSDSNEEKRVRPLTIPTWYYQHFDADYTLEVPEEGFGGWKKTDLKFSRTHTAVVVMHAWDLGTRDKFPGWWQAVPYAPRSQTILREVFPPLLKAVRRSELRLFHVVGGGNYWKNLPGYKRAVSLAGPDTHTFEKIPSDPLRDKLSAFRQKHCFVGQRNRKDVERGFEQLDFAEQARPVGDEGIAENSRQLFALCREHGVNHLIYCGFAINWCLLLSPGGMAEMQKYGLLCSVLRQATTAVENKETARNELCKEIALWRVALAFGFVFDVNDFINAIQTHMH